MRIAFNIEGNGLTPDKIWVIACKDIDTGEMHVFRPGTTDTDRDRFQQFAEKVDYWIGHNILGYDLPVLVNLGLLRDIPNPDLVLDTLIISKLVDYPRKGHSAEDYAEEFGLGRQPQVEYKQYSQRLEEYCIRKVDITLRIRTKYLRYISDEGHRRSISLEHYFQLVVNNLSNNGFFFAKDKAKILLSKVEEELRILDLDINNAFRPKLKLIRTVTPRSTKYGTISLSSIPVRLRDDLSVFTVDAPFSYCEWVTFNPSSHKQLISVLNEAAWSPVDKTETHKDVEREYNQLKNRRKDEALDIRFKELYSKLQSLKETGWKINENNLETLPSTAPVAARLLAKRILLESRRRTLTEWLDLVTSDQRIHGRFQGIGAWTHRMAHQNPNTANIPNEFDTAGKKKLYGKELRALWSAPKNRLLVGVDAEGIQLRIFAHYINDPEFTQALVEGKKDDKTDPHSLNQRILGSVCKSRAAAKRFIYALLLGAGLGKLAEILGCSNSQAEEALNRLLERYTGWAALKENVFPKDARRGWFQGLDGRKVRIPGNTEGGRKHLAMSGYLQNGEAVVMKAATLKWWQKLDSYDALLVNLVHDEWQVECRNNVTEALEIAEMMSSSLKEVGEDLGLLCPLAGSYYNDDLKDYTIATNWSKTH